MSDAGSLVKMKVRLARTLAFKPELVVFPEPTEGLSLSLTRQFVKLVRKSRRKIKYTVVLFTSDVRLVQEMAERVIFLNPITGFVVENQLRGWYHNLLPFLQPSSSKLLQLARDILQYGGVRAKVKS
jgi:ABC-type methionine transport system ATPase subunit